MSELQILYLVCQTLSLSRFTCRTSSLPGLIDCSHLWLVGSSGAICMLQNTTNRAKNKQHVKLSGLFLSIIGGQSKIDDERVGLRVSSWRGDFKLWWVNCQPNEGILSIKSLITLQWRQNMVWLRSTEYIIRKMQRNCW